MSDGVYSVLSVLKTLNNTKHLNFYTNFEVTAKRYLPNDRLTKIRFDDVLLDLYKQLKESNNKPETKDMIAKRNAHIRETDKYLNRVKKTIEWAISDLGVKVVSQAKVLNSILNNNMPKTNGVKDKIRSYMIIVEKFNDHLSQNNDDMNIKPTFDKFVEELLAAYGAYNIVDHIQSDNKQYVTKKIRRQIDIAYKNAMSYINNIIALNEDSSDCEEFVIRWNEKLSEYRNTYASKMGKSIAKKKASNEGEENASAKKEKHYKKPKPRPIEISSTLKHKISLSQNEPQSSSSTQQSSININNIPTYDPDKHWTEYKIGDMVKFEGVIYRVKDLGQIHYPPYSKLWQLGWEIVEI